MTRKTILLGVAAVAVAVGAFFLRPAATDEGTPTVATEGDALVSIQMPAIDGNAAIGQRIFDAACAKCHGQNAVGKDGAGPPLIHKIYEPGHHADEAFQRAVAFGVRSHHWRFGDMPPVEGLTRGDVAMIADFVREVQRANGIR